MTEENTELENESSASFDESLLESLEAEIANDEAEASQPTEEVEAEQHDPLTAPEFFSKEHKEYFEKLTKLEQEHGIKEAREIAEAWVNQFEDGNKTFTQKTQALAEERRQYEQQLNEYNQYNQAVQPLQDIWRAQGIAPAMGMAQLAHYGQMLHKNPEALIQEVAKFGNIDLNKLVEDQPYVDEHTRNLENQLQQMQQTIGQFQNQYQQGQTQQQQQAIQQTLQKFAEATDESGNLKHQHARDDSPHMQKVVDEMRYLLNSPSSGLDNIVNPLEKLEKAYQKAIQYVPEIQAETQAQKEKEQAIKRGEEAKKAQQASVRVNSKTKDAPKVKPSFEDTLAADLGINV